MLLPNGAKTFDFMSIFRSLSLCVLLLCPTFGSAQSANIAVASNFLSSAHVLKQQFERDYPHTLRIISGSTGKLYAQIIHGAPFDIFLAANSTEPERLEKEQRIVVGSRFTYAEGILVLLCHDKLQQVDHKTLHSKKDYRLSIANPALAPYGYAASQVIEKLGLRLKQSQVVYAENVSQALMYVATGNVDYGFVAASQIMDKYSRSKCIWNVPADWYTPLVQQAVLLKRAAQNKAAYEFLNFLKSNQAKQIIHNLGYRVP